MTTPLQDARTAIQRARQALSKDDRRQAREWAERASKLAPQLEEPWLILAAVAGPRLGLKYIQRALQVNPNSPNARRGMEWAMRHLQEPDKAPGIGAASTADLGATQQSPRSARGGSEVLTGRKRQGIVFPVALLLLGCIILGLAGWTAVRSPAVASMIVRPALASEPTHSPQWAQASIPKPTYTPSIPVAEVLEAATPTPEPSETPTADQAGSSTDLSTGLPTEFSTIEPTIVVATEEPPTAEPTWSGTLSMEYVQDTPTPEAPPYVPPTAVQPSSGETANGTHWIDVNLTQQMLYAYAGDTLVNSFVVSTGTWLTPTVTGKYKIWIKLRYSDMSGPDYYLPNVPYVMYFYKDYGLHGTYWHHNFGTPMSHGCINLSIPDAEWLYDFSYVGTVVNIHY
jgi:lipoprotein-anchoring transpeptidase ErfK/SrfK